MATHPTRAHHLGVGCGAGLACLLLAFAAGNPARSETCTFLTPLGADGGSPVVTKRVGPPKLSAAGLLLGQTNWNTDFMVDQPYRSFKFFFTADSSDTNATYPVEGYMKFSDGSSLRVIDETISPPVGTGKMFGPFPALADKQATQMNFKVGTSKDPGAIGFSYRISVQGCR